MRSSVSSGTTDFRSNQQLLSTATTESVKAFKASAVQKLERIMTMTPGESAKDKGTLFLELRDLASFFHQEYAQCQVCFFSTLPFFLPTVLLYRFRQSYKI